MNGMCESSLETFLQNIGAKKAVLKVSSGTQSSKDVKASLSASGGGVEVGLEGSSARSGVAAGSLNFNQNFPPPSRLHFIAEDQDLFWVASRERCGKIKGQTLLEIGSSFVEAGRATLHSFELSVK